MSCLFKSIITYKKTVNIFHTVKYIDGLNISAIIFLGDVYDTVRQKMYEYLKHTFVRW